MPFVVREAGEEGPNLPIGKAPLDDCFADLQRCHARALQLGGDGAEIPQATMKQQSLFLISL
jgi:hypothetical protein